MNNTHLVEFLSEEGANIDRYDHAGNTSLENACKSADISIVKLIQKRLMQESG